MCALTTHFTDIINGIIKVPESPETQGYTPTTISDIKAADPSTGITVIAPPIANQSGTASLIFPMKVPAGREGMQPSIGLQYSSEMGSSWTGTGWNISLPSVNIDTRWGVPLFDPSLETETYSIAGEQLSPQAHRTTDIPRTANKQFYPRIEGSYSKIIRNGSSPKNYWWEITDKSGTRSLFGGTSNGTIDEQAIIRDEANNIIHWALTETRSLNDNFIRYRYENVKNTLYPSTVVYTGHGTNEGVYKVVFLRDNSSARSDKTINSRLGVVQTDGELLGEVQMYYKDELLHSYKLNYMKGTFSKTQLESVTERDSDNADFYTHTFDYYNDVENGMFGPEETWTAGKDIHDTFLDKAVTGFEGGVTMINGANAIGHTRGAGLNTGFDKFTIGTTWQRAENTSEGQTVLTDINGDGLADKVFIKGGSLWYRPNISNQEGTAKFGEAVKIKGINEFSKGLNISNTDSYNVGYGKGGGSAGITYSDTKSTSKTKVYFQDFNGDGLIDIAKNGTVYFNHLDINGNPSFTASSGDTPNPIEGTSHIDAAFLPDYAAERDSLEREYPLHDVVRVWRAPFSGKIRITAPASLTATAAAIQAEGSDGVRFVLLKENNVLGRDSLLSTGTITSLNKSLNIKAGERLFFRLQSRYQGLLDEVKWSPNVRYDSIAGNIQRQDINKLDLYEYKSSDDFLYANSPTVTLSKSGNVQITAPFDKKVLSDDVTLVINKTTSLGSSYIYTKTLLANSVESNTVSLNFSITPADSLVSLSFYITSPTNVDLKGITWKPNVEYTSIDGVSASQLAEEIGDYSYRAAPEYTSYNKTLRYASSFNPQQKSNRSNLRALPRIKVRFEDGSDANISGHLSIKGINSWHKEKSYTTNNGNLTRSDALYFNSNNVPSTLHAGFYSEGEIRSIDYADIELFCDSMVLRYSIVIESGAPVLKIDTTYVTTKIGTYPISVYSMFSGIETGSMYRGWGQFAWNGNRAIDVSKIRYNKDDSRYDENDYKPENVSKDKLQENFSKVKDEIFFPMFFNAKTAKYHSITDYTYLDGIVHSSSRLGMPVIKVDSISYPTDGKGLAAPIKTNVSKSESIGAHGSYTKAFTYVAVTIDGSAGISDVKEEYDLDLLDLNGDRYPDWVEKKGGSSAVTYSTTHGNHRATKNIHALHTPQSEGDAFSASLGIGLSPSTPAGKLGIINDVIASASPKLTGNKIADGIASALHSANAGNQTASGMVSAKGNFSTGTDRMLNAWIDINGDGLPDMVYEDGTVRLNLGYGFDEITAWSPDSMSIQNSKTMNFGAGTGTCISMGGRASSSFGFNATRNEHEVKYTLSDINGDGLPDLLKRRDGNSISVAYNTGVGFLPFENLYKGQINQTIATSIGAYANVAIPISFRFGWIKITIIPQIIASSTTGVNRSYDLVSDIDGDGYPDLLSATNEKEVKVRRSQIGRTNLLRSVNRPFGGKINIEYERTGNTYNMPQSKQVLSKVEVLNNITDNGIARIATKFEYGDGYYDRYEREFYGFAKITTRQLDTDNGDNAYRSVEQNYKNKSYYTKQLLTKESLSDENGAKLSETQNTYQMVSHPSMADVLFPSLTKTEQTAYEGANSLTTSTQFEYDTYGNILKFTDLAAGTAADKVEAVISYHNNDQKYIKALPKSISVTTTDGLKRYRETRINANGNVTQIDQKLDNSETAIYDLEYDIYGNLTKILRPENYKGERMWYTYTYDTDIHALVTQVEDAYANRSSTRYDYRRALPLETTDMNGVKMTYTYDNRGRAKTIIAPKEQETNKPYTIAFDYHTDLAMPYARTRHYDAQNDGDIETYTFSDALLRPVQVKKTASIYKGNQQDETVMLVSGKVMYDAFGRAVKSYHPTTESIGNATSYNTNVDALTPTLTVYDSRDRAREVTLPDGAVAKTDFELVSRDNETMLQTRITDAMGRTAESYTDAKGRSRRVVQHTGNTDIVTTYNYSPLGEVLDVTHPNGHKTNYTYDLVGRKLSVTHPDAGTVSLVYDNAGNLLKRQTDQLKKTIGENSYIQYTYEKERLTEILYPKNIYNRVTYTYGKTGDPYGRAGRLTLVEDASGGEEYFYGKMGEVEKTIKTIMLDEADIRTYVWQATYDSWNRIQNMTYPDGEKVSYTYNQAGEFQSMQGEKEKETYPIVDYTGYDKYGQLVYQKQGNGSESNYTYDNHRNRLTNMTLDSKDSRLMDNDYRYDAVDNILGITNKATTGSGEASQQAKTPIGGTYSHNYAYDDLNRLINAQGEYKPFGQGKEKGYELAMSYDIMSNPLFKEQLHVSADSIKTDTITGSSHKMPYHYLGDKPNAPSMIGDSKYTYDYNGNPILVEDTLSNTHRNMLWDEDNRLMMLSDNGYTSNYTYNHAGERVVKSHGGLEGIYVNGAPSGIHHHSQANYTIYVNPYFVASEGKFTKHYYAGTKRVSSRIGVGSFNNLFKAGSKSITAGQKNYYQRMLLIKKGKENHYKQLGIPPGPPTMQGIYGEPENIGEDLQNVELSNYDAPVNWPKKPVKAPAGGPPGAPVQWETETDSIPQAGYGFVSIGYIPEKESYFYHSDHLGSTAYITDRVGNPTQFVCYMPYGESLTEEHNTGNKSPYKFNGKEQDSETGLYYYGARYYEPKIVLFYGGDQLAEKYPHIGSYVYCVANPVNFIDPDGRKYIDKNKAKIEVIRGKVHLKIENLSWFTKGSINASMNNTKSWDSNNLGTDLSVGSIDLLRSQQQNSVDPVTLDGSAGAPNPNYRHGNINVVNPLTKKGLPDGRYKQRSVNASPIGSSSMGARGSLLLNIANTSFEYAGLIFLLLDKSDINKQMDALGIAINDVNKAMERGMIPEALQNKEAMSDIINYVFQEESFLRGKADYDDIGRQVEIVGRQIINEISNKKNNEK